MGRQTVNGAANGVVVHVLEADLQGRTVAGIQGAAQRVGKGIQIVQARRSDEVQAAGFAFDHLHHGCQVRHLGAVRAVVILVFVVEGVRVFENVVVALGHDGGSSRIWN